MLIIPRNYQPGGGGLGGSTMGGGTSRPVVHKPLPPKPDRYAYTGPPPEELARREQARNDLINRANTRPGPQFGTPNYGPITSGPNVITSPTMGQAFPMSGKPTGAIGPNFGTYDGGTLLSQFDTGQLISDSGKSSPSGGRTPTTGFGPERLRRFF